MGNDPGLMGNAHDQAFPPSRGSSCLDKLVSKQQQQPLSGRLIMCADLSTAAAAELACMQSSHISFLGGTGCASGSEREGEDDPSLHALSAVLRGAWQLAVGGAASGEKGRLVRTVLPRNLTHARRATGQDNSHCSDLDGPDEGPLYESALLLMVQEGQQALVASVAQACGWRPDASTSAHLLEGLQDGMICNAGAAATRIPLFLRPRA